MEGDAIHRENIYNDEAMGQVFNTYYVPGNVLGAIITTARSAGEWRNKFRHIQLMK